MDGWFVMIGLMCLAYELLQSTRVYCSTLREIAAVDEWYCDGCEEEFDPEETHFCERCCTPVEAAPAAAENLDPGIGES